MENDLALKIFELPPALHYQSCNSTGSTRIDCPQAFFPWCVMQIHSCSLGSMDWAQDLWISECNTLTARTRSRQLQVARRPGCLPAAPSRTACMWNCGLCVSMLGMHKSSKSPSSLSALVSCGLCHEGTTLRALTVPQSPALESGRRAEEVLQRDTVYFSLWKVRGHKRGDLYTFINNKSSSRDWVALTDE